MSKALRYAAVTFGGCLTSGALAYAAQGDVPTVFLFVTVVALTFGILGFAAVEGES
jgi:hypothetical protein